MKNKSEHIDETILLKILDKTADDKERNLFKSWSEASVMHSETYEQLKKTNHLASINNDSLKENWEKVKYKFKTENGVPEYIELPGTAQSFSFKPNFNLLFRVAAILIFLIGISFLIKIFVFKTEQLTIYGNDLNPKNPYRLEDGSLVYLNKNSEITFSKEFGINDRKISLVGEAFFEVKRNETMPFVISAYKTNIQVLGTKFNIYSDKSEQVKVSVVSGLVAFYTANRNDTIKLREGESGIYNPGLAKVKMDSINDKNFLVWKTGILYFSATPLPEAFSLLQKQYSYVFVFKTKQNRFPTLTTTIDNMPLEAVLEELNLLLNTKNVITNDTIFFKPNI